MSCSTTWYVRNHFFSFWISRSESFSWAGWKWLWATCEPFNSKTTWTPRVRIFFNHSTLSSSQFFTIYSFFLKKIQFGSLKDVNSSLNFGVGVRTYGSEITRLSATDLGSEVPGRAQQRILGGVDVAGASEPHILAPSSTPRSVAPTSGPWISTPSSEP